MRRTPTMRYPLLLAVAGAAAVAGVFTLSVWPGSTTPSPVAPVPREGDWLNRHTEFVALARRGDVSIVFFGDSLTDHWRDTGQAIWAKHFEPLGAVNFGIGSDGTQNVLWRVQNGELPPDGAEVVVLLIGTVNLNPPDARADDVADGVTAVVREIRRRSPRTRILLLGLLPRGARPNPVRDKVQAVNAIIARLADDEHVHYLDLGSRLLGADGTLPSDVAPDAVHLSATGYQIWAEAMLGSLRDLLARDAPGRV